MLDDAMIGPEAFQAEWSRAHQPSSVTAGLGSIKAGRWSYWPQDAQFVAWKPEDSIAIGSFCSISSGVRILAGGNHRTEHISTYPFLLMSTVSSVLEPQPVERIVIGHDVWLGTNAIVLGNVTIGSGAVVAAGAVVVRDVQPYEVVGGVPARRLKRRFDPAEAGRLLQLRWWDWPDELVLEAESILRSADIDGLESFAREHGLSDLEI